MLKRLFDILASGLGLLVFAPLLLPVAILLRFTGEHEVFYRQERVGRNGLPFHILKFATMLKNSPSLPGGDITTGDDPRILPVGRVLRRTKINELPQLYNVFIGDMSVIGPRPMTARVLALFPAEHRENVGRLRPGLSGAASLVFRDEESLLDGVEDRTATYSRVIVPYKVQLEEWYGEHQSFLVDMKLLLLTAIGVFRKDLDVAHWLPGLPPVPAAMVALRTRESGTKSPAAPRESGARNGVRS